MQETAAAQLRIEVVARRTGLTKRTLRYYEELGLITPSGRSEGGFRLYTETDVALIERIHRLRESAGLPLAEILELLEAESVRDRLRRRYQRTGDTAARIAMLDEARTVIVRQRDILRAKRRAIEDLEREYDERLAHLAEVRRGLAAEGARRR